MRKFITAFAIVLLASFAAQSAPKPGVFVGNDGRWPANILYGAATVNGMIWVTTTGLVVDQRLKDRHGDVRSEKVALNVVGSKGSTDVGITTSPGSPSVSVLTAKRGDSPLQTATAVTVKNLLPGIDIEYVWEGDQVRYNVHAAAGVEVPNPLFTVRGAKSVSANSKGLVCTTKLGKFTMTGVVSYQGSPSNVKSTTCLAQANNVGFSVADRDLGAALTIDPVVAVIGLRGGADEGITAMRLNKDGNIVVCGWTTSFDFTVPAGGLNSTGKAGEDGFVAIVSPNLKTVLKWTYISGTKNERVRDIAINSKGEIWAVGETNSPDFPVKGTTIGQTFSGNQDGFAVLLSADLSTQISGVYFAGNDEDWASGIAINAQDQGVIVGSSKSTSGISTISGFRNTNTGGSDGFVIVLHPKMNNVTYFTYFGGAGNDFFTKVAIDGNGAMVVCGWTASNQFVTYPEKTLVFVPGDGYYTYDHWVEVGNNPYDVDFNGGESDVVLVKFSSLGELVFSTYFGGSKADNATGIFTDSEGSVYFVGDSRSPNLPANPSFPYKGGSDGFLGVLSADGLKLRAFSYIGGSGDDFVTGVAQDQLNIAFLTGYTNSSDFPVVGAGSNINPAGGFDGFVAKLTTDEVKQSSTLGWSGNDYPSCIIKDALGDNFIGGRTESSFPGSPLKGAGDAFIAKWAYGTLTYTGPSPADPICRGRVVSIRWSTSELPSGEEASVDFSQDNGATWMEIGSKIKSKSYSYTIPDSVPADAKCKFRIRTPHGHEAVTSSPLNILVPPTIIKAPEPVTGCPNMEIKLVAEVTGSALNIQWRKNGLPITGATMPELVIPLAQESDAGNYDVMISNSCNSTSSKPVMVEVSPKPIISSQPQSQDLAHGAELTLSVEARGQGLKYDWQHNGTPIDGAEFHAATIVIKSVTSANAGKYVCVISSDCGTTTSNEATIVVGPNGVEDEMASGFIVSPMPATESLNITIPNLGSAGLLVIRDSRGAEVHRAQVGGGNSSSQLQVSVAHLTTGTYFVQWVSGGHSVSKPLVIIK